MGMLSLPFLLVGAFGTWCYVAVRRGRRAMK
jgi:hypothetical protein